MSENFLRMLLIVLDRLYRLLDNFRNLLGDLGGSEVNCPSRLHLILFRIALVEIWAISLEENRNGFGSVVFLITCSNDFI